MEPGQNPRPSVAGYLVALVGAVGWIVGCFLPLYDITEPAGLTISFYRQISFGSAGTKIGGLLYLFGSISAIGVISILGVLRNRRSTGVLLAGAVVAWVLISVGVLISLEGSLGEFNPGASFGIGYWCCWASVVIVAAGTVMVLVARREDAAGP